MLLHSGSKTESSNHESHDVLLASHKPNATFSKAVIRRVMLSNEEVGKVGAQAPLVVSKAVEAFIEDIIRCATKIALNQGEKKITFLHLKQVL